MAEDKTKADLFPPIFLLQKITIHTSLDYLTAFIHLQVKDYFRQTL